MSENRGGDVLARGEKSAQFRGAGANLTEFEFDLTMNPEVLHNKYGLSEKEIEEYQEKRDDRVDNEQGFRRDAEERHKKEKECRNDDVGDLGAQERAR